MTGVMDVRTGASTRHRALGGMGTLHARFVSPRRASVLVDALAPLLAGVPRILDVGCGDGRPAASLGDRLGDVRIIGADVLPRRDARIPVVGYDGECLPFATGSVDATLLVDVLHHAVDPERTLCEAARVSRRAVVIKDHLRRGPWSAAMLGFMDWVGNRPHGVRLGYRYLERAAWQRLFATIGLTVERFEEGLALYPAPFGLVFRPGWHFVARLAVPRASGVRC